MFPGMIEDCFSTRCHQAGVKPLETSSSKTFSKPKVTFCASSSAQIKDSNQQSALKEFPSMYKSIRLFFAALMVFALCAIASAQSTVTGAVGVVVTDPQGAVVPNATVTVRNIE